MPPSGFLVHACIPLDRAICRLTAVDKRGLALTRAPSGSPTAPVCLTPQQTLDARLPLADIPELCNILTAISKRERFIMAELEAAGLVDEALSRSMMEREELVRQVTAH